MEIQLATTDREIADCFPVMRELRPHLLEEEFLERVRAQQGAGYRLASLRRGEAVVAVAVAGFRVGENLAWGRFLYVDDLVTASAHRSNGFGARLLDWLRGYAMEAGCAQLHLDSGSHRLDAHRFYEREGMAMAGLHFVQALSPGEG